jgi:hypothetical protein
MKSIALTLSNSWLNIHSIWQSSSTALRRPSLTALHCTALHCTAQAFTDCDTLKIEQDFHGVHYDGEEVGAILHCTALHCTALHCTALHCTALHCTALHCTAQVSYESVDDVHLTDTNSVYFNVGIESESETSEVNKVITINLI